MTDNIKEFPVRVKGEPGKTLTLVHSLEGCQHRRAEVDRKLAELTCADCGVKLNPIEFLVMMAGKSTHWDYQKAEIAKARADLAERKRCRCTKCGEWTEIKKVSTWDLAEIKRRNSKD